MLEVHPPHAAITSWKDFFIHIATITIGLLIAIALEQTFEYFHHLHQAHEMAEKLHRESLENRAVLKFDLDQCAVTLPALNLDIDRLEQARRAGGALPAPAPLPDMFSFVPSDAAWITIRDSALLPIMPKLLVDNAWKIETTLDALRSRSADAGRSKAKLAALMAISEGVGAHGQTADALLLDFSEYREDMTRYCSMASVFNETNDRSLAGETISIQTSLTPDERAKLAAAK